MIVKTGANYQAEGGYIEASADNNTVTVNKNGKSATIPSLNGTVDTLVFANVRLDESAGTSGNLVGTDANTGRLGALGITESFRSIGIFYKTGCTFSVGSITAQIVLKDGSKDCVIREYSGYKVLCATGDEPVAILGVAE